MVRAGYTPSNCRPRTIRLCCSIAWSETMRFQSIVLLFCSLLPSVAMAQRDPPVWECYLPSITITHANDSRLAIDLVFKKETGAVEHKEHQMYLLGYLKEDEPEVLKTANDLALLNKHGKE